MKRFIVFLSLFVTLFATNQLANACPPGWDSYSNTINYQGCTVTYFYCTGIDEYGFHCVALESFEISGDCDPNRVFGPGLIDEILIAIGTDPATLEWLGYSELPPCPYGICILRIKDKVCYKGWYLDKETKKWIMEPCGNFGSCNETVIICWEKNEQGERVVRVLRTGTPTGPDCPIGCKSSCE